MTADAGLADVRGDAARRAPGAPALSTVIEDAGRQRLAAYYLYSALIAGMIGDDSLAPARWPPGLSEPMERLGLTRLAPRTGRGLDVQLTPGEQATRRSPGRRAEYAQLVADLINQGTFGPLCGHADCVRLFRACIEAPHFSFVTVYGVSANQHTVVRDAVPAGIDYRPQDSAEPFRAALDNPDATPTATTLFAGGEFCGRGFVGDFDRVR